MYYYMIDIKEKERERMDGQIFGKSIVKRRVKMRREGERAGVKEGWINIEKRLIEKKREGARAEES